ncbi:MAG: UDP-N-acetylglucosamine--N-acetylmuramyl-(pentapeptide) pyrophosphoryl-undecaprenol N-acetylglucosamine transferase [Patescibacteria group bacterium]|nr:UDP-N-acetylglucosamine--N-acetylmuramyl-(pentapeptide) pyrophosphoryl-undecaprenol N-acetylglucosamine transferase [Patescibacteria group bacterium]
MKDTTFRVILTGGGSGGHVYPLLAVAEQLQAKAAELQFDLALTYIGPKDPFAGALAGRGIRMETILGGKYRRYFSLLNVLDVPKLIIGFFQALAKLYVIMPDVVFSKGGTGALPVVIAAWFYRIPVAIHESDAKPGLTNLLSAYFARKIFVSFASAQKYFNPSITSRTGTPVRKELFAVNTAKEDARDTLGFEEGSPLLVILGGSQGAQSLNTFVLENLPGVIALAQVFHQTGTANFQEVETLSRAALIDASYKNRYQAIAYLDDQNYALALTAADLVISRSGSGSLAELSAFGAPAMLVPHDAGGNGHQSANAYEYAKTGAAVIIEQGNLLPGIFLSQLKLILGNEESRKKMSAEAKKFYVPDAAEKIVQGIIEMATH